MAHARRAFTLVEMVMVVGVMSVLMFGIGSAVLIASHAMPNANDPNELIRDGASAADELGEEVRTALWFIEHTATAMTFTVPDRNNDGLPERIRYSWSGTPGDPLTRQYNGGTVVTVIDGLFDFALAYDLKSVVEQYPGPPVESAEVLHDSYNGSVSLREHKIKSAEWIGQYFTPTLPADALSWSVTRVQFRAIEDGAASGETLVQLRPAGGSKLPTDTVLEQKSMWEAFLTSTYNVQSFSFSNVTGISPSDDLCLVLQHNSGGSAAKILYDNAGTDRLKTINTGGSWTIDTIKSMRFAVYGKYITPGPTQTATRQYVTSVGVKLQPSSDASSRVVTTAPTYNMPEVLSDMWLAEFDADPTLDHNGDGVGDWVTSGVPFNVGQLSSGVFSVDADLFTQPVSNLDELTTVDIRFRDVSDDAKEGGIKLRFDRTGNTHGFLKAEVQRTGAKQDLLVKTFNGTVWVRRAFPASEFIEVRFLIDPGVDTVYIEVNGQAAGTFAYTRQTKTNSYAVKVFDKGIVSGVQFDYVRVRVGGTGS